MKALIVVDIQYDFLPKGALAVPEGDAVIPVANRLMEHFDLLIGTQDWHPPNHQSFAVQHPGKKVGEVVMLNGMEQILWPVHCVEGSHGAEFHEKLNSHKFEKVFFKGTNPEIDSYSGFYDNGHLQSTGLGEYLKTRDVRSVYLLGLATDYCVKFSALDARRLGFETIVVRDGCRAVNLSQGDDERAFQEMVEAGVQLASSGALAAIRS